MSKVDAVACSADCRSRLPRPSALALSNSVNLPIESERRSGNIDPNVHPVPLPGVERIRGEELIGLSRVVVPTKLLCCKVYAATDRSANVRVDVQRFECCAWQRSVVEVVTHDQHRCGTELMLLVATGTQHTLRTRAEIRCG